MFPCAKETEQNASADDHTDDCWIAPGAGGRSSKRECDQRESGASEEQDSASDVVVDEVVPGHSAPGLLVIRAGRAVIASRRNRS